MSGFAWSELWVAESHWVVSLSPKDQVNTATNLLIRRADWGTGGSCKSRLEWPPLLVCVTHTSLSLSLSLSVCVCVCVCVCVYVCVCVCVCLHYLHTLGTMLLL